MSDPPAAWQLPAGVSRALWDYVHDSALARGYDDSLKDSSLTRVDRNFVQRHCPPPGRLIDLGCGTGRILIPLAQAGLWVLGVDLSAAMLRVARDKSAQTGTSVQLLRANLVDLAGIEEQTFDYAVCLFSTLGMISGRENRARVLGQVHRLLRPGGRLVLHVHNRWFNFWDRHGRSWLLRDVLRSLNGSAATGDRGMPVQHGQVRLTLHHFTRREILRLLGRAGFQLRELRSVSVNADGVLQRPFWFGWVRAYGYLIAAERRG